MYDTNLLYIIVCDSVCMSIISYNCIYKYYLIYFIYYYTLYAKDT